MASSSSSSSSEPTTRSRTLLYISYRDSRASSSRFRRRPRYTANYEDETPTLEGDEQDRLIDSDAAHVAIDTNLPPKWYSIVVPLPLRPRLLTNVFSGWTWLSKSRRSWLASRRKVGPIRPFGAPSPVFDFQLIFKPLSSRPVSSLDKLHAKHVLPGFSDRTAEEREIEAATSDVTKVCPFRTLCGNMAAAETTGCKTTSVGQGLGLRSCCMFQL